MHHLGKKIIFLCIFSIFLFFGEQVFAEESEITHFVITAYYSPLPDQNAYITGSYAGDIRLNGKGTHTASGKEVFPGLLAGPSNYPFGTKIYIEGYGIGSIEDRGGAIVKAGERGHDYDRLDIWMGYGDAGLARAKTWGVRTVTAKIVVPSAVMSLQFGESSIGSIGNLYVEPESSSEIIKKLQNIFTNANLYNGEIDGIYESIADELLAFQIREGVVKNAEDWGAGYFGNKTIAALAGIYGKTIPLIDEPKEKFYEFNHINTSEKYKIILDYGDLQTAPDSQSGDIIELQKLFTELGEYDGPLDGSFNSIKDTLVEIQIQIGVISSSSSSQAGYFGPKTKTALWAYYGEHGEEKSILGKNITFKTLENTVTDTVPAYVLTTAQKRNLDATIETLRGELGKRAFKKGISKELNIEDFRNQLQKAIPKISKENIKVKLQYIADLL